jgi:molybdopterin synthase catalytic subunit
MRRIVDGPIDVAAVRAAVSDPGFGAIVVFEGVGRDHFEGRPVRALEYEAFPEHAEAVLEALAQRVEQAFPGVRAAAVHRTGRVAVGEPSLVLAVGSAHRPAAFDACRALLEALKAELPVWKKEIYDDGSAWKANAPAHDRGAPEVP